ncbi:uncharacterized protein [Argopecten irradians]|uniref:uncharacterized protein n=1 Tax=Argopecten irradians TaxID=31199 RepID=UPI0037103761
MDAISILLLVSAIAISVGDARSSVAALSSHEVSDKLLTLISDLENRVKYLEDSRTEDAGRMHDMQSEIDELKSENNRLWTVCDRTGDAATVNSEIDPFLGSVNIGSEGSEATEFGLSNYVVNNTPGAVDAVNEDVIWNDEADVPGYGGKTDQRQTKRNGGKDTPSTHRISKRVVVTEPVAFHANIGHSITSPSSSQEVVFGNIVTNTGNSYSSHTGTFTCQQTGIYVFSWNVVTSQNHFVDSHLMKNGVAVASTVSGNGYYWDSSSGLAVVHVDIGDEVWVSIGNHKSGETIHSMSMFSGFKLSEWHCSRVEDSIRINNMQSEIDKLRYENDQLRDQYNSIQFVKTVTSVKDKKLSNYHYDDDSPLQKFKVNNDTVVMETQKKESGTKNQDIPQHGKVANRSLFTRREAPRITKVRDTKRVASGTIAFHANLGTTVNSPAKNREIVFDRIITNNENGYSQHTGTFTCQDSGTYVFSWNIVTIANHFVDSYLIKNGVTMASTVSASAYHSGASTGLVVLQLNSGDDVWVTVANHESGASVMPWSMFSGFKLN